MPKISVIIPVYNAREYLGRCLDSVCNQTLEDVEIICVDDCSTDNSLEILEKYGAKYKNLKVVHLEKNQGESIARNTGLKLAKGEYIAFVDNDDEIDLNFYEKLYEKASSTSSDIAKAQVTTIGYDGKRTVSQQIQNDSKFMFVGDWWTAIYKRSMIKQNNILLPENYPLGGDLLFLNEAVAKANKLELVHGVYYYHYKRENSGDSKVLPMFKVRSALDMFDRIIENTILNIKPCEKVYSFVFLSYIMACFYISQKSTEVEAKELCARMAIKFHEKCQDKDNLKLELSKKFPHLFLLIEGKDVDRITSLLVKSKNLSQLVISELRSRVIRDCLQNTQGKEVLPDSLRGSNQNKDLLKGNITKIGK
ncbi:MAG: glycosyltransferase [Rickettsiales bacterium]|nr:glycosyltransferase [Rickettsiales bacterium]